MTEFRALIDWSTSGLGRYRPAGPRYSSEKCLQSRRRISDRWKNRSGRRAVWGASETVRPPWSAFRAIPRLKVGLRPSEIKRVKRRSLCSHYQLWRPPRRTAVRAASAWPASVAWPRRFGLPRWYQVSAWYPWD